MSDSSNASVQNAASHPVFCQGPARPGALACHRDDPDGLYDLVGQADPSAALTPVSCQGPNPEVRALQVLPVFPFAVAPSRQASGTFHRQVSCQDPSCQMAVFLACLLWAVPYR